MMKKIAVTGATGFVGKRMIVYNSNTFHQQVIDLRRQVISTLDLRGVDAVIHLAGMAHRMEPVPDKEYFDINYELTRQLADKAKSDGAGQFIYISSTKVYGDDIHEVLNESSACNPTDAYGASKLKAEQYLQSIQSDLFTVAIVRPPLVYGPGVKGNMIRLLQLADKNIPLPLAKTNNARSMVFADNLVELINTIIDKKASGVFIAGDSKPLATDELIAVMRQCLGNTKGLVSIPAPVRKIIKQLKPSLYTRLFGSFVADNSSTNSKLQFTPPYSSEEGIARMVNWFKQKQQAAGGE